MYIPFVWLLSNQIIKQYRVSCRYSCGGTGTDPMMLGWTPGMPGSTAAAAACVTTDCMASRLGWLIETLLWVTGGLMCAAPGPGSTSRGLGCVVAGLGWGAGGLGWVMVGLWWAAGLDWVWGLCFWATIGLCFSDAGPEWAPFTSRKLTEECAVWITWHHHMTEQIRQMYNGIPVGPW